MISIESAKITKTPPLREKGGEKQYKDYEKNPTLFFLNALASKTDAKISIIFFHGTLLDIFLEIFPIFYPIRVQIALSRPLGAVFTRQQSLLGGHDQLTSVVQVAVHVVSTVHDVHGASGGIDGHVRGFSLVMCSSLSASGMRLSSFRMCHFFVILTS